MAETLQITTTGTTLHALQWRPAEKRSGDAFLCVHGVESHAGWFDALAKSLVESGHCVLAYDRSGFGKSSGPRGDLSSIEAGMAQLISARDLLQADHERVHLIGMSWGSILCAYAATVDPHAFHSWNFVVPGWFPRRTVGMGKTQAWLQEATKGKRAQFPLALNPSDFTNQPDQQALIAADPWRNQCVTGRFLWHSARMLFAVRSKLHLQPLVRANLFLAENDVVINNHSTRRLFSKMKAEHIFCREYSATRHSLVFEVPSDLARDLCTHTGARTRPQGASVP